MLNRKKLLVKDGEVMAVIRPSNPQRALDKAMALVGTPYAEGQKAMDAILQDPEQTYTFIGLATKEGEKIVDPVTGIVVSKMQPGDSFVSYSELNASRQTS